MITPESPGASLGRSGSRPFSVDLLLSSASAGNEDSLSLRPLSIHGMLWLQTHFEDDLWGALASGGAEIDMDSARHMVADCQMAGLKVSCLNTSMGAPIRQ